MRRLSIALVLVIVSVTACNGPAAPGTQAIPESANPVTTVPPTGTPVPGPLAPETLIPTPALQESPPSLGEGTYDTQ
jgi:hypothetical protein